MIRLRHQIASYAPIMRGGILFALLGVVLFGAEAIAQTNNAIDFAAPSAALELQPMLKPYHAPKGGEVKGSAWYMTGVVNGSVRPATRILLAGQPAGMSLRFFPRPTRPAISQMATSESGVIVEHAKSYGRRAYRITLPPATTAEIAVRVDNANARPSVIAWTEPALVAHNRQIAIFVSATAGLIGAAALIMAGLAVMTGHIAPRWAAYMLTAIFFAHLSTTGMFDAGWEQAVGGPYGVTAFFAGLALMAALRLADVIAPVDELWHFVSEKRQRYALWGLVALLVLAFVGVPGATLLMDVVVVLGTAAITAYLVHRGRLGLQAARVLAPSSAIFSLVTAAGAVTAVGGFTENIMAPAVIGGFAATGAVLLALAIAAGEGVAVIPAFAKPVASAEPPTELKPKEPLKLDLPQTPLSQAALQAIGASHQGVFDYDFRNGIVKLSAEGAGLIGLKNGAENIPQTSWLARVHPDDRDVYKQAMADYRGHPGLAFRIEFRVRSESGRYPWFELRATMMGDGAIANRCLGLMADVTARKESEATVVDRGLHDALTGLGNRMALMEELERLGDKLSETTFALLDIDRFKAIHASLGDEGGDAVLVGISQRLMKRFGGLADVYRVGGDAFALVFPRTSGSAEAMGAELVDACAAPFPFRGRNVFAPASVGVLAAGDAEGHLDLLRNAELALADAKRQGGSCARVYARKIGTPKPSDPVALEADLREALSKKQLELFYQPIVRLSDGTVAGFEALLRWRHPTRGLIAPADFVAHSEQTGLIASLGRFALERAVQDLAQWQKFFPVTPPVFTSVNVSRRQLRDGEFESFLKGLLDNAGLEHGTLKLEVTESAVVSDGDIQSVLTRIAALGAGLALDDFGTGLSSLNQLKDLPFEIVKIDKSFLLSGGGRDGAVVLNSIVSLAHELKRAVVAEGVESEKDAAWLKEIGCEFAQGFLFAEPMPRANVADFLARHARIQASGTASLS